MKNNSKKVTGLLKDEAQSVILAMDQISLYHQATLTQVWAPKGQTSIVRMGEHISFYGTLAVRGGYEIALPAREQTGEVMAEFVRLLLLLFPTQTLLFLLDRAS